MLPSLVKLAKYTVKNLLKRVYYLPGNDNYTKIIILCSIPVTRHFFIRRDFHCFVTFSFNRKPLFIIQSATSNVHRWKLSVKVILLA